MGILSSIAGAVGLAEAAGEAALLTVTEAVEGLHPKTCPECGDVVEAGESAKAHGQTHWASHVPDQVKSPEAYARWASLQEVE